MDNNTITTQQLPGVLTDLLRLLHVLLYPHILPLHTYSCIYIIYTMLECFAQEICITNSLYYGYWCCFIQHICTRAMNQTNVPWPQTCWQWSEWELQPHWKWVNKKQHHYPRTNHNASLTTHYHNHRVRMWNLSKIRDQWDGIKSVHIRVTYTVYMGWAKCTS